MARAQLIRAVDPYKFKQGQWVRVQTDLSGMRKGVITARSSEECGEDTIYWVALRARAGYEVPRTFMQKVLEADDAPR